MTAADAATVGGTIIAAVVPICGYLRWLVRTIVREENEQQLTKINGTYRRRAECELLMANVADRQHETARAVEKIQAESEDLRVYAHSARHDLANAIQRLADANG